MAAMASSVAGTASSVCCSSSRSEARGAAALSSLQCSRVNRFPQSWSRTHRHQPSHSWRQVKCAYSSAGYTPDYSSSPIDVVAEVKSLKILVLGGNGFVGTAICKRAVAQGISVASLSRSGRPTSYRAEQFLTQIDTILEN